jgi:hypothetical protein
MSMTTPKRERSTTCTASKAGPSRSAGGSCISFRPVTPGVSSPSRSLSASASTLGRSVGGRGKVFVPRRSQPRPRYSSTGARGLCPGHPASRRFAGRFVPTARHTRSSPATSSSCGGGSGNIASVRKLSSSSLDLDVMTRTRATVATLDHIVPAGFRASFPFLDSTGRNCRLHARGPSVSRASKGQ